MNECGTGQTSYYKVSDGQQSRWREVTVSYSRAGPHDVSDGKRTRAGRFFLFLSCHPEPSSAILLQDSDLGQRKLGGLTGRAGVSQHAMHHSTIDFSLTTPYHPLQPTRTGGGSAERLVSMVWAGCRRNMRRRKYWEMLGMTAYPKPPPLWMALNENAVGEVLGLLGSLIIRLATTFHWLVWNMEEFTPRLVPVLIEGLLFSANMQLVISYCIGIYTLGPLPIETSL